MVSRKTDMSVLSLRHRRSQEVNLIRHVSVDSQNVPSKYKPKGNIYSTHLTNTTSTICASQLLFKGINFLQINIVFSCSPGPC